MRKPAKKARAMPPAQVSEFTGQLPKAPKVQFGPTRSAPGSRLKMGK
jgi:hypothetical protein